MKRIDEDYIALTNNEAREIQRTLMAAKEATEQLALYLASPTAARKLARRIATWQNRIHNVWVPKGGLNAQR